MRMRVARPTARLPDVLRFYEGCLGLRRVAAFEGHDGYDGVIFRAGEAELEFTSRSGVAAPAPADDAHLVLYFEDADERARVLERLRAGGHPEVRPSNPWWRRHATTFRDPDGWEVVLVRAPEGN